MSGITELFGKSKKDEKLVNLFASKSAGPVKRSVSQRTVINVKTPETKVSAEQENESESESESEESDDSSEEEQKEEEEEPKKKKKRNDEDDGELEDRYMSKILNETEEKKQDKSRDQEIEEEEYDSDSDSEDENENESSKSTKSGIAPKAKSIDLKESEIEKAERTIFIGNLNMSVITSKKDYKQFKRHFVQYGEIESIRFRSIAFSEPLPRKAAFVQHKIHPSRESVNAYVVFKTKESSRLALKSNGEVFLDLHIRVDSVSHPSKIDNKRSIFVGNLDFEEKEEELWSIFAKCGEIEFVRIIRDSKTNVGKGFGYVQFKDFVSLNKALLLDGKPLGSKKRKLRISRSKTMKPSSASKLDNRGGKNRHHLQHLSDDQKTKLGRAKRLGKADRSTAGQKVVVEGTRAKKGDRVTGIKNGKGRVKKPRHTKRSTEFKKVRDSAKSK